MVDSQSQGVGRIIKLITGELPMPNRRRHLVYRPWKPDMWEDFNKLDEIGQAEYIAMYGAPEEWEDEDVGA